MKKKIVFLSILVLVISSVIAGILFEKKPPKVEREERLLYKKNTVIPSDVKKIRYQQQIKEKDIKLQKNRAVMVFVALWDSPPDKDLYWGQMYGMRTYFSKDKDWQLISTTRPGGKIQERILFYNKALDLYVDALAYHTDSIKTAITDFVNYAYAADHNALVIYVGHDGLMDFKIDVQPRKNKCDVMVFSCASDQYFSHYVDMTLSTYTYMAPEAYGVMAAIEAWAAGDDELTIRKETAKAYAKYQKISVSAAERTFVE